MLQGACPVRVTPRRSAARALVSTATPHSLRTHACTHAWPGKYLIMELPSNAFILIHQRSTLQYLDTDKASMAFQTALFQKMLVKESQI